MNTEDGKSVRTRRAMLAGLGGAVAALVAQGLGRAAPVAAHENQVTLGAFNYASTLTSINTGQTASALQGYAQGSGIGVEGRSISGNAVSGSSSSGIGVFGWSSEDRGVYAYSGSSHGAYAYSDGASMAAAIGWSAASNSGIYGYSGAQQPPASPVKTGVYGYAAQDASARGVTGQTTAGRGVQGIATTGVGVHASAGAIGTAFQAQGQVRFSSSGLATVSSGANGRTISAGVEITATSKILCTLESNQTGLFIERVVKNLTADSFAVYLNAAVNSGMTVKVAWFVIS